MVVSALHKEVECKEEKLNTGSWSSCSPGSKTNPTFQHANKPSWISPNEVLPVVVDFYSLSFITENFLRGAERGRLTNFLPPKRGGGGGLFERGGLIEDLR